MNFTDSLMAATMMEMPHLVRLNTTRTGHTDICTINRAGLGEVKIADPTRTGSKAKMMRGA